MLLFRLRLLYHHIGLSLATAHGTILYSAHLLTACRHSGNLPGKTGPEWPDMDKIIEMHNPEGA